MNKKSKNHQQKLQTEAGNLRTVSPEGIPVLRANPSGESATSNSLPLVLLFSATLFISATLMFSVQPMFGKLLLPFLGGSPSVWNTCMVFYQTVLFLGYLYAHAIGTRLPLRRQAAVHLGILVVSLVALPIGLPQNPEPPTESNPVFWLFWMLTISIGLPFFVVSATAPLFQKWFSRLGHQESHDPYFLYAASNAGSLIALLSYPFLIEPGIGLGEQKLAWTIAYIAFCAFACICAVLGWRNPGSSDITQNSLTPEFDDEAPARSTLVHWLALAFVPSSLLLATTNFISTDIASVPLLWVIPLALYLLSFVYVFSRRGPYIHPVMVAIQPMVLLPFMVFSFINPSIIPYWLNLFLHLLAFFCATMVCHGELARCRPHTRYLTKFYLVMAFAGMLGGMFNTFVAPILFDSVIEYPIMIAAALSLRPTLSAVKLNAPRWRPMAADLAFPAVVLAAGLYFYQSVDNLGAHIDLIGTLLILLAGIIYASRYRPLNLAVSTSVLLFFAIGVHGQVSNVIYKERTFFGVLNVRQSAIPQIGSDGEAQVQRFHELWHGTTKHGAQNRDKQFAQDPLNYYSRPGPMGQFFTEFEGPSDQWRIGVVGLGAGALACYSKPSQTWDFFEIDPGVVSIAEDTAYFSYLSRCAPRARMITGDARLSLSKVSDRSYDLLVLDAFSSDAIPTHLLTREALSLYFSKLKVNGMLAFHITNRHLALKNVLAALAQEKGLAALIQEYQPNSEIPQIIPADWVVLAKQKDALEPLRTSRLGRWRQLPLTFKQRVWTDDYSNIISVWKTE